MTKFRWRRWPTSWSPVRGHAVILALLFPFVLAAAGCSILSDSPNPGAADDAANAEPTTTTDPAPTTSTLPPLLGLDEAAADPAFDGANTDAEATAAMEVLLENELDFNAPGLANGVGDCTAIDGGALSQFLGSDVVVVPERLRLTPAPYVSCQLSAASDSGVTVGYIHAAPDKGGFEAWFLSNPAEALTALIGPGDTAGWAVGTVAEEFFSILVVEQGGTQVALEFRNYDGASFTPGKVPGMVGALSQATADLAT